MGSIEQGLGLLQLGSTAFTTGSDAVDGLVYTGSTAVEGVGELVLGSLGVGTEAA